MVVTDTPSQLAIKRQRSGAGFAASISQSHPKAFFIMPGHERLEVERVTDQNHRYAIVEKIVPLDDVATRPLTSTDEAWPAHGI